jgi:hypothetical protein
MAFNPQANYTDWATATGRWILMPTFVDRRVSRGQSCGPPQVVNLFSRPIGSQQHKSSPYVTSSTFRQREGLVWIGTTFVAPQFISSDNMFIASLLSNGRPYLFYYSYCQPSCHFALSLTLPFLSSLCAYRLLCFPSEGRANDACSRVLLSLHPFLYWRCVGAQFGLPSPCVSFC